MSAGNSNLADAKTMLAETMAEAQVLKATAGGSVTDVVAAWLASQYLLAEREKLSATDGAGRFEVLRTFVQDWSLLRRGEHSAARLQLDREELDWQRANSKTQKEQEFREWIQRPEIRREFLPDLTRGISPETIKMIEAELHLL